MPQNLTGGNSTLEWIASHRLRLCWHRLLLYPTQTTTMQLNIDTSGYYISKSDTISNDKAFDHDFLCHVKTIPCPWEWTTLNATWSTTTWYCGLDHMISGLRLSLLTILITNEIQKLQYEFYAYKQLYVFSPKSIKTHSLKRSIVKMTFPLLLIFHTQQSSLKNHLYQINCHFGKVKQLGVRRIINSMQPYTTIPLYRNLFALAVTDKCNSVLEICSPKFSAVENSVARARAVRNLSYISAAIGGSNHVNCTLLTGIPAKCKSWGTPISNSNAGLTFLTCYMDLKAYLL